MICSRYKLLHYPKKAGFLSFYCSEKKHFLNLNLHQSALRLLHFFHILNGRCEDESEPAASITAAFYLSMQRVPKIYILQQKKTVTVIIPIE